MARRFRFRALIALLIGALLAGCTHGATTGGRTPDPDTELQQFVAHLQAGEIDKAAAMTTNPGAANQTLTQVMHDLAPKDLQISPGAWKRTADDAATVPINYSWQLPVIGIWKYTASWTWHRVGSGSKARWTIDWAPSLIHPQLGAQQTLAVRTDDADAGTLVDRNNQQLVAPVTVFAVQADPTKITNPTAAAIVLSKLLKRFDPTLTVPTIVNGIAKADKKVGYTVINLRQSEFVQVQQQLVAIKGLTFPSQVRDLGPTKDFARALLADVEPVAKQLSTGTAGWQIVSVDSTGAQVTTLARKAPSAGNKVMLTIDIKTQEAAEKALAAVKEPATLVAIQPSTGDILAVAQNAPANANGAIALTGRYPPGSTFKIVTGTSAIDHKLITPTTVVPCPGVWTLNSQNIHNEGSFDLGDITAMEAFAHSCNTSFAQLAAKLPLDALNKTAKQYGVGIDFVIPGITTLTGQVPVATSRNELAEDGFGQGVDLVTPFSEALMAATAATGNMPTPTLIRGQQTKSDQPAPARTALARADIKAFMRAVVTDGTAKMLQDIGDGPHAVYAKTGTAEYSDAKGVIHAHAWTVGFRGDLAFSALIVGGDDSKRTNAVLHDFLAAVPAG